MVRSKKIIVLLIISFGIILPVSGKPSEITENRLLFGYVGTDGLIHVKTTDDGLNWVDGAFPANVARHIGDPENVYNGVGIISDTNDSRNLLMYPDPEGMCVHMGVGYTTALNWDIQPQLKKGIDVLVDPCSAPVGVALDDNRYLIAFGQHYENEWVSAELIKVLLFDSLVDQNFIRDDSPHFFGSENSYTLGRPAITIKDGVICLAFTKLNTIYDSRGEVVTSYYEVIVITGEEQEIPNKAPERKIYWNSPSIVLTDPGAYGVYSSPDLTHDDDKFYLAVGISEKSTGFRDPYIAVFESTNGQSWSEKTGYGWDPCVMYLPESDLFPDIAAFSDGTIFLMTTTAITDYDHYYHRIAIRKYSSTGKITDLDEIAILGTDVIGPFYSSLVRVNENVDADNSATTYWEIYFSSLAILLIVFKRFRSRKRNE